VSKGYIISSDDEFSVDGNVAYTINNSNIVRSSNQATLRGKEPNQTLLIGSRSYSLNTTRSLATTMPNDLRYNADEDKFSVSYYGIEVTYSLVRKGGIFTAQDNRRITGIFGVTNTNGIFTFKDTITKVSFTFDPTESDPIEVGFVYTNNFFNDALTGVTYFINVPDRKVVAISYLRETTKYGFTVDDKTYFIHYNDVSVVFPIISGENVNVGTSKVGADLFTVHVDEVDPVDGPAIHVNTNSFEINNNVYTVTGTPNGRDYSGCQVIGHKIKSTINDNRFPHEKVELNLIDSF
jgi:hypothetical protein